MISPELELPASFNKRKPRSDYWSRDPFISCDVISSAMSRKTFEEIKSPLKYSKAGDREANENAWCIRALLKLFQMNILKFGVCRTALSVDEMMVKSYERTSLKHFIRGKPIRFGLKFWGFPLQMASYCVVTYIVRKIQKLEFFLTRLLWKDISILSLL